MYCLFCKHKTTEVIETRVSDDGTRIRRRRLCSACGKRFTTHERAEELPIFVIKRDGRHERFDRNKLLKGILTSVEKTTVSLDNVNSIVTEIESTIMQGDSAEVTSESIGEMVASRLKKIDKVAYIRFSSVFKRFVDVEEFERELKKIG